MATEEITISELELADEVLADMTLPVDTATETRAVTLKQLRAWLGSSLPIGSIFASVGKIDDERFTLLDGKTISRIGTYEAFCNKVVENVQAGKWKACTEEEFNLEVSETGQCGKFVVSNDYVRIPKLGNSLCSGVIDGTIAVVGNGMTLGVTNGNINYGLKSYSTAGSDSRLAVRVDAYGVTLPAQTRTGKFSVNNDNLGLTTDPTKSGIEAKINSVEVFYYMVISTEGQTAEIGVDINKVYEDLNLKANSNLSNVDSNIDYVVESYNDGTNWYRVYKSGWIEQGGYIPTQVRNDNYPVTLLKPYIDTNYNLITNKQISTAVTSPVCAYSLWTKNKTVSGFTTAVDPNVQCYWQACGQGA